MSIVIDQLAVPFGINVDFVNAILVQKSAEEHARQASSLEDFQARVGDAYKYIAYALGTNICGYNGLSRMLALAAPMVGGKALDIGCGYGGFMQAFAKKGYQPYGVEIDAHLVELARINLKGTPYDFQIHACELFVDETELGKFDLITINDVLEHLQDPIGVFYRLAGMLNPGEVLAIYAPNGQSVFNTTADPHNRELGSSSMPGMLAKFFVQPSLNSSGYSLGDYLDLAPIEDLCRRNRMKFIHTPHDRGERPEQAIHYLTKLVDRIAETRFDRNCPPILAREVQTHLWQYIAAYAAAVGHATRGPGYTEFNDHYLARAWAICYVME